MDTKNYTKTFVVAQSAADVFAAITNVRGWWSEGLIGNSANVNDVFIYEHKPWHISTQKLIEVIANQKVVWLVTDSNLSFTKKADEWTNTTISFEISAEGDKTKLVFTHHGLVPEVECYTNCTKGWDYYLQDSLMPLITTGKGKPDVLKKE